MQVEVVDLSSVSGVKDHLRYGIARTNEMAEKKSQTYRTAKPLYVYFHLPAAMEFQPLHISSRDGSLKQSYLEVMFCMVQASFESRITYNKRTSNN
jgi:hypothetical protein